MIQVYSAADPADAHLVRALLAESGIDAQVQGEELWGARGALPVTADTAPSVWVHDADAERARTLLEDYERRRRGSPPPLPDG